MNIPEYVLKEIKKANTKDILQRYDNAEFWNPEIKSDKINEYSCWDCSDITGDSDEHIEWLVPRMFEVPNSHDLVEKLTCLKCGFESGVLLD